MFSYKIEWVGSPEHQRFLLNRGDGNFWTGDGWSPHLKDALLYATHQDACREFGKLADEHFRGCPVREFQLLTTVKVFADQTFTLQELKDYLSSVCTLVMTPSYRGQGPAEGSFAQVEIPWDTLSEVIPTDLGENEQ